MSEDADAWVPSLERTQTGWGCRFHQAQRGLQGHQLSSHAPAVGRYVCEDSEQELAGVARLEGGGDDDVASLGLLRPQEDASRVDVDGAGGLMLQTVHAVLPVLFHLCGNRRRWATRGHTRPHASLSHLPPATTKESVGYMDWECPELENL